jgi:lipoprotein signal peptidase
MKYKRIAVVAILVIIFDQITKIGYEGRLNSSFAGTNIDSPQDTRQIIFGILFFVSAIFLWARRPWWAVGMMIGGMLSNIGDRIFLGGVRDPVAYGFAWWNWADAAAIIGSTICFICFWIDLIRVLYFSKPKGGGENAHLPGTEEPVVAGEDP